MRADRLRHLLAITAIALSSATFAAGEATPVADDPALESRVIELSQKLRCLVCQNETIAASRAPLAVDLRNQVREQLAAGKTEQDVVDFLVTRYGDFVLYTPPFRTNTLLLWLGPAALGLFGLGWLSLRLRRRAAEATTPELSDAQRRQARALLGDTDNEPPPESRT